MKLDKFFSFLLPKDRKFFPLFIQVADNMVVASDLLVRLIKEADLSIRNDLILQIRISEQKGDGLTRILMEELNSTFITPFDREDIHDLVTRMDDVVDYIYSASKRINLYKPAFFPDELQRITELIRFAILEIQHVLQNVKTQGDFAKYKKSIQRIRELETTVDDIYQEYITKLFAQTDDAVELIKKRDILITLEKTIDKCEDVSNIFSTLIVKMS